MGHANRTQSWELLSQNNMCTTYVHHGNIPRYAASQTVPHRISVVATYQSITKQDNTGRVPQTVDEEVVDLTMEPAMDQYDQLTKPSTAKSKALTKYCLMLPMSMKPWTKHSREGNANPIQIAPCRHHNPQRYSPRLDSR